jgi:hypothetical protein
MKHSLITGLFLLLALGIYAQGSPVYDFEVLPFCDDSTNTSFIRVNIYKIPNTFPEKFAYYDSQGSSYTPSSQISAGYCENNVFIDTQVVVTCLQVWRQVTDTTGFTYKPGNELEKISLFVGQTAVETFLRDPERNQYTGWAGGISLFATGCNEYQAPLYDQIVTFSQIDTIPAGDSVTITLIPGISDFSVVCEEPGRVDVKTTYANQTSSSPAIKTVPDIILTEWAPGWTESWKQNITITEIIYINRGTAPVNCVTRGTRGSRNLYKVD